MGVDVAQDALGAQEFLTFTLGEEEYAIDILRVQEIRGYDAVTRIANTPHFIKGVINLRGTIVPIVDLRLKFNLSDVTYSEFTVVIILSVAERVIGIVVDSVSDVITLGAEQVKPAPQFSSSVEGDHLKGIGTVDDRMLIIIDIERLLLSPSMGLTEGSVQ
ncbi:MAG: chemotaxis protein CheW [Rhodocyclaceae bacterium]|nr:chemotaxis protein CheW [Rhodocyclaceae bacterium]